MLIRFGVSNHHSIRNYQELLLTASRRLSKASGLTFPVPVLQEEAVPVVAIYGPNASGKSNLLAAISTMRDHVVYSHQRRGAGERISRRPFLLDDEGKKRPTRFDCTFTLPTEGQNVPQPNFDTVYEYGFEFNDREFTREWLHRIIRKERRSSQILFERHLEKDKDRFSFSTKLRGENMVIRKLTRPNSLFLSTAAQNNHPELTPIFGYFRNHWSVMLSHKISDHEPGLARELSESKHLNSINKLLEQADVGLVGVGIKPSELPPEAKEDMKQIMGILTKNFPDETRLRADNIMTSMTTLNRLQFLHSREDGGHIPLDYESESRGTLTLLSLLISACATLSTGSVLVLDELDASLHPRLQKAFISLFKQKRVNRHEAQLVFSTHDTTILETKLLRLDEIWLTDKNRRGASKFTPLTDFDIRSRDNIERFYRHGRLGSVPATDWFDIELEDAEAD